MNTCQPLGIGDSGNKALRGVILVRLCAFLSTIILSAACSKNDIPDVKITFTDPVFGFVGVTSATVNVSISANFGDEILERGVCWDTLAIPTIQKNKTSNGKGAGSFTSELTGLKSGTKYFLRSYGRTSNNVVYGSESTFTTLKLANVQTLPVGNILDNSAVCNGNLVSDGGLALKELGFCIDTVPHPDTSKMIKKLTVTTSGVFSLTVDGLQGGRTYYVVAYAITDGGVAYGNEVSFKTAMPAVITTAAVTSITETSVIAGGSLISDGGARVILRGVCWDTKPHPFGGNNFVGEYDGATGNYISSVSNLLPNTTYYLRAFALNGAGYGYGEEVSFITLPAPSTSITMINTMTTSAVLEGIVSTNGGTPISERGVCWAPYSVTNLPTIDNNKLLGGSGIGKFSVTLSGLKPNTWYAARTYVKTDGGYFYSTTLTIATPPTVDLIAPVDQALVGCCQVNFSWQNIALYYEFELSRNVDFGGTMYSGILSCSDGAPRQTGYNYMRLATKTLCVSMPDATYNGIWYWRVKVYDQYSPQEWSEVRSFNFQY